MLVQYHNWNENPDWQTPTKADIEGMPRGMQRDIVRFFAGFDLSSRSKSMQLSARLPLRKMHGRLQFWNMAKYNADIQLQLGEETFYQFFKTAELREIYLTGGIAAVREEFLTRLRKDLKRRRDARQEAVEEAQRKVKKAQREKKHYARVLRLTPKK